MSFLSVIAALAACRGDGAPRPLAAPNADVKKIEISRGQESFTLIQDAPSDWRVVPPDDAADPGDVGALLDGFRELLPQTRLSNDSAAYGLAADATVVRAASSSGRTLFTARFGRRGLGAAVHMSAAAGANAYLGIGPPLELLVRGAQDWRDRRLLPAPCVNVELDSGRGWRPASREISAALCGLRATAILPPLPQFLAGLDKPVLRVRAAKGSFAVGALMGGERWISVEGREALFRAPAGPLASAAVEARRSPAPAANDIIRR